MTSAEAAAWRMEAMCAALGVPVEPSSDAHGAMAARCAHCVKGEACRLWRLGADRESAAAPGYCLNAEAIAARAAASRGG